MDDKSNSIDELSEIIGLEVIRGKGGYWNREYKKIPSHPENWGFVESGDAALTRKVRKGKHWVVKEKEGGFFKVVGTLAPVEIIEQARS